LGLVAVGTLMAIPESRAQSQDAAALTLSAIPADKVPPPMSVATAQYFEKNPEAWKQFVASLPLRPTVKQIKKPPLAKPPTGGTWENVTTAPSGDGGLSAPILLTDGTIMVHDPEEPDWWKLTPDITGSYTNGTWSQLASMPVIGGTQYGPLYFASAVLPDGKVIVMGGEYNIGTIGEGGVLGAASWQSLGAIYDPLANTWTAVTGPSGCSGADMCIGDAQSVVLPDGTFMLGACCASEISVLFNEASLNWTATGSPLDGFQDEQSYNLLQNGSVLTVDISGATAGTNPTTAELYSSGTWSETGTTVTNNSYTGNSLVDDWQCTHAEIGPAAARYDGTVVAFGGSSGCDTMTAGYGNMAAAADPTSIYNPSSGKWTAGPNVGTATTCTNPDTGTGINGYHTGWCTLADAPAVVEPNGSILFVASPGYAQVGAHFFEFSTSNAISQVSDDNDTPSETSSFYYNFLVLPSGQILQTDLSTVAEVYVPVAGTVSGAAPNITSAPSAIYTGATYPISGTQFNGLTQGGYYGDDFQGSTNYPIVRITNSATGHVFYARTFNHSTMSIAPSTTGSTNFTVPDNAEIGPSTLVVIANGIPSAPANVWVQHSGYATAPDFTGDGGSLDSDILWRNASGQAEIWLMNGTSISAEDSLGVVNNGWRIVGTGDFNGDGNTDILWRNISGAVEIWMMNGSAVTSAVNLGVTSNAWTIVGTGDFTGSGNDDILWRNANGEVYIWFMNGTAISSTANLGVVSNAWTIVGVGDFNTDGKADILWRNTSGAVEIWLMNGSKVLSETNLGVASTAWTVDATADFNGTGFTRDILWRNSNGNVDIWFMGPGTAANSVKIDSTASLGAVSNAWTIVGTGKFTGADSDILWRNVSGAVDIWSMSGAAISSTKNLGVVPLSWTVIQ
jgi:hypothetical protein